MTKHLKTSPLAKFSLSGEGSNLEELALKAEPLLGNLCLSGNATVWYAQPGTGKTLIALALTTEAVGSRRIDAENVYYVNADDSQEGIANKVKLLDDYGIHSLAPGQNGFKMTDLVPAMEEMAEGGTAKGSLIIIDTIKKLVDLMNKDHMRKFGLSMRNYVMAGGSLLMLAHTNKNRGANDNPIYAGTSDLVDDTDAVYIVNRDKSEDSTSRRVVRFKSLKKRGPNPEEAYYQYDAADHLHYQQRLLSVAQVDPNTGRDKFDDETGEKDIIENLHRAIHHGKPPTKMRVIGSVSSALKVSKRKVAAVLEANTADDPNHGLWAYDVGERGAHHYRNLVEWQHPPVSVSVSQNSSEPSTNSTAAD